MPNVLKILAVAILLVSTATAYAQSEQWVHVRVENAREGEKVRVNIPVALLETMLPVIESQRMKQGKIRWDEKDLEVEELRRVWKELRKYKNTEFMTIETKDTNIRVFNDGSYLRVQPQKESQKKIDVKIPLNVVDALLSGTGEELNLMAAVQALKELGTKEIISIQSEDSIVQVWIDENNRGK